MVLGILQTLQAFSLIITIGFLAWVVRGWFRRTKSVNPSQPSVSVLVAARNEAAPLPLCLGSLAEQDYPPESCEFVIINDASTDNTGELAADRAARDARFRVLNLPPPTTITVGPKKRALAAGLAASSGEIILILDADCVAPREWITRIVRRFDPATQVVCGVVEYEATPSRWGALAAFEGRINCLLNAGIIGSGGALSCSGANFAYRRSAFLEAGGFDTGSKSLSGDDDLLLQRLQRSGAAIRFCSDPQARVRTTGPTTFREYWRRKRRHLSAGKRYAAPWIVLAAVIYLGCLATLTQGALWIAGWQVSLGFVASWGVLSLALFLAFTLGSHHLRMKRLWWWGFLAALLFPIYFVLVQPLTLFSAPAWKGRKP